ncbi:MAG: polysaccharide biosynthesis protein [Lachnospiraceae bacterium]|nr:polysaccharide biosynthesis protein [Lachnospiraceae bacterium]
MAPQAGREKSGAANFVVQGSILAAAGILVRIIGLFYRIPLIDIIGDEGNGYYTSAFSIYSILLIISSYSLPTAVSKMVSARIGKGQYCNSARILRASFVYAACVGGIAAGVLWFGADFFAGAMKMPYSSYALRTLAPTVWVMAFLGVLRGYFQGMGTMVPTAISQILEQIVNAVVSIGAAWYLFREGMKANLVRGGTEYSYAFGAAGGTLGTGAGAFIAFLFCGFLMLTYRKTIKRQCRKDRNGATEGYGEIAGVLTLTILPIVLSSTVYNISSVIDNFFFGQGMAHLGQSDVIAAQWGIFGKYHTLFMIPVAIANALSSSLIPSLSRAMAARDRGQVLDKVTTAIRFSMLIAIPASVGLTVLSAPVNNLLFPSRSGDLLVQITIAGASAVAFYSLSTVSNAILQGINRMNTPLKNAVIALGLHIAILLVMLYGFKWGIYAVIFSNILFALTMCLLNGRSIRKYLDYRQEYKKTFLLPFLCSLIMGAAAYGVSALFDKLLPEGRMWLGVQVAAAVFAAIAVYGVCLIKLKAVDEVELYDMPAGRRLVRIARKCRLL